MSRARLQQGAHRQGAPQVHGLPVCNAPLRGWCAADTGVSSSPAPYVATCWVVVKYFSRFSPPSAPTDAQATIATGARCRRRRHGLPGGSAGVHASRGHALSQASPIRSGGPPRGGQLSVPSAAPAPMRGAAPRSCHRSRNAHPREDREKVTYYTTTFVAQFIGLCSSSKHIPPNLVVTPRASHTYA